MTRALINYLNTGEFLLLLMVVVLCISFIMFFSVRRFLPFLIEQENLKYVGFVLGTITGNYAFLLGFIIYDLWKSLHDVQLLIVQETDNLELMTYSCLALPSHIQNEVMEGIRRYIHAVIYEGWPSLRWGEGSQTAQNTITSLFHILQSYTPETKTETTFYNKIVNQLDGVLLNRSRRLEYLDTAIIPPLRFMLGMGLLIIIFLVSLVEIGNKYIHALIMILVSAILSFNVGLALLLDYPFSGSIAASPKPFTKGILAQFKLKEHIEK